MSQILPFKRPDHSRPVPANDRAGPPPDGRALSPRQVLVQVVAGTAAGHAIAAAVMGPAAVADALLVALGVR